MNTHLNASSRIMFEAAQQMGIECTTFGDHETILMKKGEWSWYTRGSRISYQSSVGKTIADLKPLTKKVLQHFHLPTAAFVVVENEADLAQLHSLQFPVVMKPLSERHGKGVKVGIQTNEEAADAFQASQKAVLFEEMLRGTEYRIVCVNYQFIAAAFRKPAHVIGDGKQTVQQLIDQKNRHPWRGEGHQNNLSIITVTDDVTDYLQEQGLRIDAIPQDGQEVLLRKTANLSTGGESWDVTDQVSKENQTLFEQIARVCDLNVAGIDVMCESLETPITQQAHGGVIEVNASPGLRMHHYPVQGQARNIAQKILEYVLTQKAQGK
jgi:cyanophycin synthetase